DPSAGGWGVAVGKAARVFSRAAARAAMQLWSPCSFLSGSLRPGVMAARLALDEVGGVRVPGLEEPRPRHPVERWSGLRPALVPTLSFARLASSVRSAG